MSLYLIAHVWALQHLEPQAKFILLAYADSASVWPPGMLDPEFLAHLARKTGYSVEDVRTVMHALGEHPTLVREE